MEGLTVTDVARLVHRHPDSLRRYERDGLIPPAKRDPISGWRLYGPEDIAHIKRVLTAQTPKGSGT